MSSQTSQIVAALPTPAHFSTHRIVNGLGMSFVWVPAGACRMGSPPREDKRDDDETAFDVTLTRGFFLGATPVTRGQFGAFVKATKFVTDSERRGGAHRGPSGEWKLDPWCTWRNPDYVQGDDHPVVCASWNDTQAFCAWLADQPGGPAGTYRLPTEAEWEYACRAGTTTPFFFGDVITTDQANCDGTIGYGGGKQGTARRATTPVGSFPPNAHGLYDMHGNVWEWCSDWYGPYPEGKVADYGGPNAGRNRVVRGGSWRTLARFLRSATRNQLQPSGRDRDIGFRICFVPAGADE